MPSLDPTTKPALPAVLYKYCSIESAIKILDSRCLHWKHPAQFDDVFECHVDCKSSLTSSETKRCIRDLVVDAAFGKMALPRNTELLNIAHAVRTGILQKTREEFAREIEYVIEHTDLAPASALKQLEDGIARSLQNARVLCLTAIPNNSQMWGLYAQNNAGVVLGFPTAPQADWMSMVGEVEYADKPKTIATPAEWAKTIVMGVPPDPHSYLHNLFRTKHRQWSYQREWRAIYASASMPPCDDGSVLPVSLGNVPVCELCFGPRTTKDHIAHVVSAASRAGYKPRVRKAAVSGASLDLELRDVD